MGTRADFYIGTGESAQWLGSVAWDGYEWCEDLECALMKAKTEKEFLAAIRDIANKRDDFTSPNQGWPWPWENSFTTDRAYAFVNGKAEWFAWGKQPSESDPEELERVCDWPDMTSRQNVTYGERSGLIIVRAGS